MWGGRPADRGLLGRRSSLRCKSISNECVSVAADKSVPPLAAITAADEDDEEDDDDELILTSEMYSTVLV